MDANRLLRDIFAILPKPILYGFLAGYLDARLAERALPLLLLVREEGLPLADVTAYFAVVVAWSPYPVGVATFLVFLFLESRNVRRDNR